VKCAIETCGATPHVLHNMSTPARTKVQLVPRPVSGRVLVFDLAHALVAQGSLNTAVSWRSLDLTAAQLLARERWDGDARRLLADLDGLVRQCPSRPAFLVEQRGALFGWTIGWSEAQRFAPCQLCTDIQVTLAVLARRVGDLLLLARQPEPSWERLFGTPFALDDDRLAAVAGETIAIPPTPPQPVRTLVPGNTP